MLTDKAVRAAASRNKTYKLADSRGLHLHVSASGHQSWRYNYRFESKDRLLTLGAYPEVSLADAREKRDEAKKILRDGRDPRQSAKRSRLIGRAGSAKSFEEVARDRHATQVARWKPVHANDVITSLERDVFPHLGAMPLAEIDKPLLLSILRKVEKRGAIETARRIKQRVAAICRYVNAEGAGLENPATDSNDGLKPLPPAKRYPALIYVDAIRTMIGDIDRAGASPVNRFAARLLALTAQRPGMVRFMEWDDIAGIDWGDTNADTSEALWKVPESQIKQELHLRTDEAFDHPVPLSAQAVDTLRAVRWLTGRSPFVFPGARSGLKPISEKRDRLFLQPRGPQGPPCSAWMAIELLDHHERASRAGAWR